MDVIMPVRTLAGPCLGSGVDARFVDAANARAMAARAERLAVRIERCLRSDAGSGDRLGDIGAMARSSVQLERHLTGAPQTASASSFLERFATLRSIASGRSMRLQTSIPDIQLTSGLARSIALSVCELIEVVELAQSGPPDLMLALEERDGDIVVALAAVGGEAHPVPTGEGAAAMQRAERLVEAVGGSLVRGVRDGMMLVGVSLPVRTTIDGARADAAARPGG